MMKHNRLAIAIAWQRFGQASAQKDTALSYRPTDHKQKQAEAFEESIEGYKIWLSLLGYTRKDLEDGGCTFKHRKLVPSYVVIGKGNTMNKRGSDLYKEYCGHVAAED